MLPQTEPLTVIDTCIAWGNLYKVRGSGSIQMQLFVFVDSSLQR